MTPLLRKSALIPIVLLSLFCGNPALFAQFNEDFADGNFSSNPTWQGDTDKFIVNPALELQLSDMDPGESYLSVPANIADSVSWTVYFRLDFSPSSSNRTRIYLLSDSPDLNGDLNGYYIQVGESLSDDNLELYRQSGGSSSKIWEGTAATVATFPEVRLLVTRSAAGVWEISADFTGGSNYVLEGSVTDNTHNSGSFFGFWCDYTISNVEKFFFDDIVIDPIFQDMSPPILLDATALSATMLEVSFDEALDPVTAQQSANYTIDNGISVTNAVLNADPTLVTLTVSPMTNGSSYTLTTNNIEDINGNASGVQTAPFVFAIPQTPEPFDILINEIMADPTPSVGLPNAEYIELYNRSGKILELDGFAFVDATGSDVLSPYLLLPGTYVLLCDDSNVSAFNALGINNVLAISSFPALTNGGEALALVSPTLDTIHRVAYTLSWYQDPDKAEGGYSLELINPTLTCAGASNWVASTNSVGGTPGAQNSVFDDSPDLTGPKALAAAPQSNATVQLIFDEPLDPSAANSSLYSISGGVGAIVDADIGPPGDNSLLLTIGAPFFQDQTTYTITLNSGVTDCSGNSIQVGFDQVSFTYYDAQPAERFDILINEIFPDPDPSLSQMPNAEFVELYNRSTKAINLAGFTFSDEADVVNLPSYILPPNSYVILCHQSNAFLYQAFGSTIGLDNFPGLNNDGDYLSLTDPLALPIHEVDYDDSWYQDDQKDGGGFTLELINPNLVCAGASNWRASNALIGGTPGSQNSFFQDVPDNEGPRLSSVVAYADNTLLLKFNELLDGSSLTPANFSIAGVGSVIGISLAETPNEESEVTLTLSAPLFQDGNTYTIVVGMAVEDCAGNLIDGDFNTATFTFLEPENAGFYDVLINEFMADPTLEGGGNLGVPEAEYIELFNASDKVINLLNWKLADPSKITSLPVYILAPGEYVTVYEAGSGLFEPFGPSLAVPDLIELGNSADRLELLNEFGEIIHAVSYTSGWYQDTDKNDGGYSLEMINPNEPCLFSQNWRASNSPIGGTPGTQNSLYDTSAHSLPVDLVRAYPLSDTYILVYFSHTIDRDQALEVSKYTLDGPMITGAFPVPPLFDQVILELDEPMVSGVIYTLSVAATMTDCAGDAFGMFRSTRVSLPESMATNDVIINEILFNPNTGGVDFLELYNRSSKVLNVGDLVILNGAAGNEVADNFLFFPQEYLVLTEDPINIQSEYVVQSPFQLLENALPSFLDDEGNVRLQVPDGPGLLVIDEFDYSEDYHYPLLDDEDGVSLERINPEDDTQSPANWHSAAEAVGFATPTYQNSQFVGTQLSGSNVFTLQNITLSPDGDGFEDVLLLDYETAREGFTANIRIFDAKGRLIKKLVENELLARTGSFKWDGTTDELTRAPIGIYVVWFEVFDPEGIVMRYKEVCVVAAKF